MSENGEKPGDSALSETWVCFCVGVYTVQEVFARLCLQHWAFVTLNSGCYLTGTTACLKCWKHSLGRLDGLFHMRCYLT